MNNGKWVKSVLLAGGSGLKRGYVWIEIIKKNNNKTVNLGGSIYPLKTLLNVLRDRYNISDPKIAEYKPAQIKIYGGEELKY